MVPWHVMADPGLTRIDLLVYHALLILRTATEVELMLAVRVPVGSMADSMRCLLLVGESVERLRQRGYTWPMGDAWSVVRFVIGPAGDTPVIKGPPSRKQAQLYLERVHNRLDDWSVMSLLGLFYEHYRKLYSIEYNSGNIREDRRHIELLLQYAGKLAPSCIEALFTSPQLKWVTNKNLAFLSDPNKISRWVAPAAQALQQTINTKPEWRERANAPVVQVHDPLNRTGG